MTLFVPGGGRSLKLNFKTARYRLPIPQKFFPPIKSKIVEKNNHLNLGAIETMSKKMAVGAEHITNGDRGTISVA